MKNEKLKTKSQKFKLLLRALFWGLFFSLLPFCVFGANLFLEPKEGEYYWGDHFGIKIRLNLESECINTISVDLAFPNDILFVEGIDFGESIINLWVEKPTSLDLKKINNEGKISFSGGIPGGYCGRIPGDPGLTNTVAEIRFFVPSMFVGEATEKTEEIKILETSQVFLNDGRGTPAKLSVEGSKIKILTGSASGLNEWKEKLLKDKNPPEPFEIQIHRNPEIFEGKYFAVFFTTDKETGVDYYMVKEGEREWKVAKSPYLLENQNLDEEIKVKAIDRAGNERVAIFIGEKKVEKEKIGEQNREIKKFTWNNTKIFFFSGILFLIILIFPLIILLRKNKLNKRIKENGK